MNIRKITSLTLLISFVLLIVTSVILYIVPQGRVAYWADWHLLGLSKTQWGNLHINLGVLMLMAGLLHIYYNWKPVTAYLKNKAKQMKVFTPSFNVALAVTLFTAIGTYYEIPPMSVIIYVGEAIKDKGAVKYGEPPYGHAELSSLKLFSKKQDLDLNKSLQLLTDAGLSVTGPEETLAAIARANNITPMQVYDVIKPALKQERTDVNPAFPDSPPPGFGNMTLAAVCSRYHLAIPTVIRELKKKSIHATAEHTVKEIAKNNGMEPMTVFEALNGLFMKK
ncbi:protein of unknown function [Desulfocicer vacuolatum DSM 3385]|uniref:Flavinylation-associated cytochrome domain-containing protein n=1 Tax=Desulfocicer vacuolatum DSM 3385 TaxID=1121400 RepID=A0A1W2BFN7_9BACT|nr:DUF4405 domain-containing protein [Desulfocicer vacuolatum]SMC71666.1 protein of unknown function [Desulfocicer vacuolatum DSM 3385]